MFKKPSRVFHAMAFLLLASPVVSCAQGISTSKPAVAKIVADKVDINTATANQLQTFPSMGAEYAKRIIEGRPYANKGQLVSRGVIPAGTYEQIKDQIIATRPKKEK
ncbi:helix-hairpin-helix domain-containing protein [Granulicella sp. dw_53]|uniref:ComEA family DNA-binding protein n=1 Tax=Granulicella sp. dw_53 TaxID=2719792 RepID=UPI00210445A6|nr:helix-hairpin-helix domain-containing protein [Granulicella sp. dw_53]